MSNDKMRAEFEEWAERHTYTLKTLDGEYAALSAQILWQCWQASRAAQVVELPSGYKYPEGVHYLDKDAVESALDAAGVAYK